MTITADSALFYVDVEQSFALREGLGLRVFENEVLRRIFWGVKYNDSR
jgi:hypothetical protein